MILCISMGTDRDWAQETFPGRCSRGFGGLDFVRSDGRLSVDPLGAACKAKESSRVDLLLPELLELGLCGVAICFLHSCEQNSFNEDSLKQVKRLKKLSACFLGAVLGTNVCVYLLQLVFARYIYSGNYTLMFPIKHVIFILGVLMLSRFWLESKKLKDDNTLFI